MTGEAPPEERAKILELVNELHFYALDMEEIRKQPMKTRKEIADRVTEIRKIMKQFKAKYPAG